MLGGQEAVLTTYVTEIEGGTLLVVAQAFYPTFRFPNYISTNGIGKVFADGILVKNDGKIEDAPIDLLLEYQ